jgi:hypothetical protein
MTKERRRRARKNKSKRTKKKTSHTTPTTGGKISEKKNVLEDNPQEFNKIVPIQNLQDISSNLS